MRTRVAGKHGKNLSPSLQKSKLSWTINDG
jgi:hypothetical protein